MLGYLKNPDELQICFNLNCILRFSNSEIREVNLLNCVILHELSFAKELERWENIPSNSILLHSFIILDISLEEL
ncbi:MAG TPA: hypothetical protein DCZ30_08000 [Clostridiales bacterium]|nr:hypothetical protein [Clostridiales bacterium]